MPSGTLSKGRKKQETERGSGEGGGREGRREGGKEGRREGKMGWGKLRESAL